MALLWGTAVVEIDLEDIARRRSIIFEEESHII
jgi:hypothetical protein